MVYGTSIRKVGDRMSSSHCIVCNEVIPQHEELCSVRCYQMYILYEPDGHDKIGEEE